MQQQGGDYSSSSYYHHHHHPQYPQSIPNPPNLNPPNPPSLPPPSYASAPPYSAPYPDYSSSSPSSSSYPSPFQYNNHHHHHHHHNPQDPQPTAPPSFSVHPTTPPPPPLLQPQLSSSFPQFETHGSSYQQTPPPPPAAPHQPQPSPHPYYPTLDQYQPPQPNYTSPSPYPNPKPIPSSPYSSSLYPPTSGYDSPYDGNFKMDHSGGGVVDDFSGRYGGSGRERSEYGVDGYGDGVYAYQGSKVEPYGARGTAPKSSTWSSFDDFGRPIGSSTDKSRSSGSTTKIAKAVPKAEVHHDVKSGVQKFRVKLLGESGGQSTMDVLCQVGLDGIRMLDPSTSRTLRIYPLDAVTRCETTDSSTLSFWSKTSVDIEPRRIRLQSNSYTTSTLLDTVTAAIVQFKEMGGRSRPPESSRMVDQPTEKKKGFADWMNFIKPTNEEKDYWVPDEAVAKCTSCGTDFNAFVRRHHCRNCGDVFCDKCTHGRIALTAEPNAPAVRVCDRCMAEVSHRLSTAKDTASRSSGMQSHEDLAKKLQEEMEKNRLSSSGSKSSNSSGKRMKEVACPTCTVHLQVQVPVFGSETIECGVCQHPFLVSAH